jgi:uncharacterized membrane protein HdeD (DUF308 family)
MKVKNQNKLIAALFLTLLGLLFLIWKGGVISIAMTVLGVMLIVQAVFDVIGKNYVGCVVRAVLGIVILIFGWAFVTVALYVMAAVLLIYGLLQLIEAIKAFPKQKSLTAKIVEFIQPAICIVIAVCLLFNQGATVSWAFIVAGVFLIVQGVLGLIDALTSKAK